MSGGHFDYQDRSAGWRVEEGLAADIEWLKGRAVTGELTKEQEQQLEIAQALEEVAKVTFEWLHDYDWAASSDTCFETAARKSKEHRDKLLELLAFTPKEEL